MKRTETQRWRKCVALVAPPRAAANIPEGLGCSRRGMDAVADLIRRKETPCVFLHARSAECKLDGRTTYVHRFDRTDAFARQVVLSSGPVFIANRVPTLP